MITNVAVLFLTVTVVLLSVSAYLTNSEIAKQKTQIGKLYDSLDNVYDKLSTLQNKLSNINDSVVTLAEDFCKDRLSHQESLLTLSGCLADLGKKLEKAEALIDAHAELEREAAESERRFQEGLNNLLGYGVNRNG